MIYTTVGTVADVRTSEAFRTRRGAPLGMREIMGKTVDPAHFKALTRFVERVKDALTKRLADEGASDREAVMLVTETGRKYDKVLLSRTTIGADRPEKFEVIFFVDRDTGAIYGPKSPQAPNERRYFGTIHTAQHWNWANVESPEPLDEEKAGVKKVRAYGGVSHYEAVQAG